ncbi:hypothetical protein DKT77_12020 [Meridianimarinicoccus roseus]|uniref:Uncharacterized protein n=2 Tax=Meridianimarinicoccus roseus TaxID=2072018 RepID=A0A2V2LGA4_9RHOB|nr:hypothetical protein DKT77_12020 [Meridianimarinicoccus roseus]
MHCKPHGLDRAGARRIFSVTGGTTMKPAALCLALALPAPAVALDLWPRIGWDVTQPVSLAYDAELCGLWIAQERPEIVLVTPGGREIRRFDTGFPRVRAITVTGDTILVGNGFGDFRHFDREGRAQGPVFEILPGLYDIEGIHLDPEGAMLIVGDDPALLVQLDADGNEVRRIRGETLSTPMVEPQGIGRDPVSGNILVVDDNEGLNALFEFSAQFELLSVTPLSEWGMDAEAVAIQPQTGQMFIGYDWSQRVMAFDWVPTRPSIPEPLDLGPPCPIS